MSTAIEHKAVIEPILALRDRGFEVTLVPPDESGRVNVADVLRAVRSDTGLVSLMHVNNETGVVQPVAELADALDGRPGYLHVDASQGFGKDLSALRHPRVDLISVSGHKLGTAVGIGALIARKRAYRSPPMTPIFYGGGQERGLRPGTVPAMLVAGFGAVAEAFHSGCGQWVAACVAYRQQLLADLRSLPVAFDLNMDLEHALPNCVNLSFRDGAGGWLDSEAVLLALKGVLAASNGSACTSAGLEPSHVLTVQHLPGARVRGAVRLSWCEASARADWAAAADALRRLL